MTRADRRRNLVKDSEIHPKLLKTLSIQQKSKFQLSKKSNLQQARKQKILTTLNFLDGHEEDPPHLALQKLTSFNREQQ